MIVRAIAIIHDEHRSLAAVLHGMLYLVREIKLRAAPPNFPVFDAMIHYVDTFQERFHHPKEDAYLFRLLRLRHPASEPLIERLESEHRAGGHKISALEQALARYRGGGAVEFPAFAEAVQAYASFHWDHMRAEEEQLLPLARTHLTAADWKEIDDAWSGNADPLVGASAGADFEALFRRIVNLAPPPIGVGPATPS
jgi:hemerythrin-like domain-containing protein